MKIFIALDTKDYEIKKGILPVNLTWRYNTMEDWCSKVEFTQEDIVVGHSLGAAVALVISEKTLPKELHLYSPSPIFLETMGLLGKSNLAYFGKKRQKEFRAIPKLSCPVTIYVGSLEHRMMKESAKLISSKIPTSRLVVIPGKNHQNIIRIVV